MSEPSLKINVARAPHPSPCSSGPLPSVTLVVQGRFHAFALAQALLALDMPVRVLTNYPAFMAERFGVPRQHVTGYPALGMLHRYAHRWGLAERYESMNRFLHRAFSRWAGSQFLRQPTDIVHPFSGVARELYDVLDRASARPLRMLVRGSAHIRDQHRVLRQESKRAQSAIELPGSWMIQREMNEYKRSHKIMTLSSFALNSFMHRGYAPEQLLLLSLGSKVRQFRPERSVIDQRIERLRSGQKLSALGTGTFCLRKGALDFIATAKQMHGEIQFRWVGNISQDALPLMHEAKQHIEFIPRVPEAELPLHYDQSDLYVFPTIEDGYAITLAQAKAGCLPIIATDHCAAPDLIVEGETGWLVPIRQSARIVERLRQLDQNREQTIEMVEKLWRTCDTRDWEAVGRDFIRLASTAWTAFTDGPR